MGRGLPGYGTRAGGDRAGRGLDQGSGAFPDDPGLVAKAKAGELNLDRTLWAMRRAAEPKPPPNTAREGGLRRSPAQPWA